MYQHHYVHFHVSRLHGSSERMPSGGQEDEEGTAIKNFSLGGD